MTTVGGSQIRQRARQSPPESSTIHPNAFLKLLVAELQYQDPTKPMDNGQLVQQSAAMSQTQQAALTNQKLSSMLDQLSVGQSASLIGRTVLSGDGSGGTIEAVRVNSDGVVAILEDGRSIPLGAGVTIGR